MRIVLHGCIYFMTDILENEDDEERPQKKKRKLSSSHETGVDICFIKVIAACSTPFVNRMNHTEKKMTCIYFSELFDLIRCISQPEA